MVAAPHDLDGDCAKVGGVKGLAKCAQLVQDATYCPYVCSVVVLAALHMPKDC